MSNKLKLKIKIKGQEPKPLPLEPIEPNKPNKPNEPLEPLEPLNEPIKPKESIKEPIRNKLPWIEKHRPSYLDDIIDNKDIINIIRNMKEKGDFINLLFSGPPGTGKTTLALSICIHIYGIANYKNNILELNASDERGIDTVRNKIPDFAERSSKFKYKIIILDEADAMTQDAQCALRIMIEKFSKNTRFILIVNNLSKIISGLQSRCINIHFNKVKSNDALIKLKKISEVESLNIKDSTLEYLLSVSKDFRNVLQTLQCLQCLKDKDEILIDDINKYHKIPTIDHINEFLNTINNNNIVNAIRIINNRYQDNEYILSDFLDKLLYVILDSNKYSEKQKINIINRMSDVKSKVNDCYDVEVHLPSLVCSFYE